MKVTISDRGMRDADKTMGIYRQEGVGGREVGGQATLSSQQQQIKRSYSTQAQGGGGGGGLMVGTQGMKRKEIMINRRG